ncbi:unnamed protein product, partial [marine sediment metagenome]
MAYCTKTDILLEIPETVIARLTDDSGGSPPAVDEPRVARAIANADAVIDASCESSYTVPFVTVPNLIRKISVDLSIYNLYSRKENVPAERDKRNTAALALLEDTATLVKHIADSLS